MVAAGGSFLGFLAAAFLVIYPDTLDDEDDDDDEEEQGSSSVKSEATSSNSTEKKKQTLRNCSSKPEVESSVWMIERKILELFKYKSQNAQAS